MGLINKSFAKLDLFVKKSSRFYYLDHIAYLWSHFYFDFQNWKIISYETFIILQASSQDGNMALECEGKWYLFNMALESFYYGSQQLNSTFSMDKIDVHFITNLQLQVSILINHLTDMWDYPSQRWFFSMDQR